MNTMACSIMVMQTAVNRWTAGSSPATPVWGSSSDG